MKAAVVKGKRLIVCEEVPTPSVQPGTLLLKTIYCSICGSELEYLDNRRAPHNPLKVGAILGHEFSAEVAAVGEGVTGWSIGDRVTTGDGRLPCGQCYYCRRQLHYLCQGKDVSPRTLPLAARAESRPGAMAEYFLRSPTSVQKIPDNVSDEEATLVEPLRVGVSAVKLTGLKLGESAVVIGAGKIGLGAMLCAKAAGAAPVIVIDLIKSRLDTALEMGADAALNPNEVDVVSEVVKLTEAGPDAVLILVRGGDVLNQAIDMVRRNGIIGTGGNLIGAGGNLTKLEIDPVVWYRKQIRFVGVAGGFGGPSGLIYTSMRLIANKQVNVKPIISEIMPLKDVQRAFDSMYSGENIVALLKP